MQRRKVGAVREQPPQQPPPVQRIRIKFAKRGRMRFLSHRDFSRAFERALMRAGIPMAYSSGFNPHPRISYAGAAPTGSASEAEYVEIAMAEACDPQEICRRIDEVLSDGIDMVSAIESPGGTLADTLEASTWLIELDADPEQLAQSVEALLGADEVIVSRMTKKGMRDFDCRAATVALAVASTESARTGLHLTLQHGTPAVRPGDVLQALQKLGAEFDVDRALLTRLQQGVLEESGQVAAPW